MKKIIALLFLFLATFGCFAQGTGTRIQITVTITNLPQNNASSITINGSQLFWTNATGVGAGYITIGTDNGTSATNLWAQISGQGLTGPVLPGQPGVLGVATNAMTLLGNLNQAMIVTLSGSGATAWGNLTTNTQTFTNQTPVIVPISAYSQATTRTLVASNVMAGMITYCPFDWPIALLTNNWVGANFSNGTFFNWLTTNSVGSNNITFNDTNNSSYLTNAVLTNAVENNSILVNPISTNLVNYGNAISSVGGNATAQQFGAGSTASAANSLAVGLNAAASANQSAAIGNLAVAASSHALAIGNQVSAFSNFDTAIGSSSQTQGPNATAIGEGTVVQGSGATAIGASANASFSQSTAVGFQATTTASNQVMLGSTGVSVYVNNNETVGGNVSVVGYQTNTLFVGTNNWRGDIAFQKTNNSAVTSGVNAAVSTGQAVYVKITAPASAFSIAGLANGRDGRYIILENFTANTMTILNQSGSDPTAANRIVTGTGGSVAITNSPGTAELIYDSDGPYWTLMNHSY